MNVPRAPETVPTRRPQGSRPEIASDELVDLGAVMKATKEHGDRLLEMTERLDRIEKRWELVLHEHETTQREAVQLQRQFATLIAQQHITQRMLGRLGKLTPALLGVLELVRYAVTQYLQTHH